MWNLRKRVFVYTHVHVCMPQKNIFTWNLSVHVPTDIHTYIHTYIYIYTHIYTYIQTYMHACIVRYACIHAFASGDGLRCLQTSRFFVLVPAVSRSIVHAGHTVEVESFVALGCQGIGFTWGFRGSGFLLAHSHGLRGLEYTMYMYIYIYRCIHIVYHIVI